MKKGANPPYGYYLTLAALGFMLGFFLLNILLDDQEPSIFQSGSLVLLLITPIGLILGAIINLALAYRVYRGAVFKFGTIYGLLAFLSSIWLALLLFLINAALFFLIT